MDLRIQSSFAAPCVTPVCMGVPPSPHFFHLAVAKGKAEGALIPSMTDLLINLLD